jgi:hypothetical protein
VLLSGQVEGRTWQQTLQGAGGKRRNVHAASRTGAWAVRADNKASSSVARRASHA